MKITMQNLSADENWKTQRALTRHAGEFWQCRRAIRRHVELIVTLPSRKNRKEELLAELGVFGYWIELPRVTTLEQLEILANLLGEK